MIDFEMIFEYYAHLEGASVVAYRHRIKGALGILTFVVLTLSGGKIFLSLFHSGNLLFIMGNCLIVASWIAFIITAFLGRILSASTYFILSILIDLLSLAYLCFVPFKPF